jgi:hypothetical protein
VKQAIRFLEATASPGGLILLSVGLIAVQAYLEKNGFTTPYPLVIDWRIALSGTAWLMFGIVCLLRDEDP